MMHSLTMKYPEFFDTIKPIVLQDEQAEFRYIRKRNY